MAQTWRVLPRIGKVTFPYEVVAPFSLPIPAPDIRVEPFEDISEWEGVPETRRICNDPGGENRWYMCRDENMGRLCSDGEGNQAFQWVMPTADGKGFKEIGGQVKTGDGWDSFLDEQGCTQIEPGSTIKYRLYFKDGTFSSKG